MSPLALADQLGINIKASESLFKEYAQLFPKLTKWLSDKQKFGLVNGYTRINAPHNGIRWFPLYKDLPTYQEERDWKSYFSIKGEIERASANTVIQGTGAVICKEALVACRELLKGYDGLLLAPIHDELNFEIHEDYAEEFIEKASKLMVEVGNKYVTHVNMAVDSKISDMWVK